MAFFCGDFRSIALLLIIKSGFFMKKYAPAKVELIQEATLTKLRGLDCQEVLEKLDIYSKKDIFFKPKGNPKTSRIFVNSLKFEGEMIVTGPKFYCPVLGKGGFGAIDLLMFLERLSFRNAVTKLEGVFNV
jgi:hypothetical protein